MTTDQPSRPTKVLAKYVLSSITAMWVFSLYTMVDGMFVARGVGPDALAAVNLAMPCINVSFTLSILLSVGASTKASICKGRQDLDQANRVFTQGAVSALGLALVYTALCLLALPSLVTFLGADQDTSRDVTTYLRIILLFNTAYVVSYYLEVLAKADGFPQLAIVVPACGAVCNIALDYLFIFHFGWGVAGAAWATGIAQVLSMILFAVHFLSRRSGFSFVSIRWKGREALAMAKLGVADSLNEFSVAVTIYLFNRVLGHYAGADGIAIYTVISYVSQLILMTMVGLNQGMQPLLSYYYGKGDHPTMRWMIRTCLSIAATLSGVIFFVCYLAPGPIVGAFLDPIKETALYQMGLHAFRLFSFWCLPVGLVVIIAGCFTAVEKAGRAMAISLCRGVLFVAAALPLMVNLLGTDGIWLTMAVAEGFALLLAGILWAQGRRRFFGF